MAVDRVHRMELFAQGLVIHAGWKCPYRIEFSTQDGVIHTG